MVRCGYLMEAPTPVWNFPCPNPPSARIAPSTRSTQSTRAPEPPVDAEGAGSAGVVNDAWYPPHPFSPRTSHSEAWPVLASSHLAQCPWWWIGDAVPYIYSPDRERKSLRRGVSPSGLSSLQTLRRSTSTGRRDGWQSWPTLGKKSGQHASPARQRVRPCWSG